MGVWAAAVVSVLGGGLAAPLILNALKRRKPETRKKAAEQEELRTTKAASEAVEAVRGVLSELRRERTEDRQLLAVQQGELIQLRSRVETLIGETRRLHSEHTECMARESALRARVAALEAA